MFSLEIYTKNDAFFDKDGNPDPVPEILNILKIVVAYLENGKTVAVLYDTNGNKTGWLELDQDPDEGAEDEDEEEGELD
jgi:hypothetical protein